MMSFLELLSPPPQLAWLGWLILGLSGLTLLLQIRLAVSLWLQDPPALEKLHALALSGAKPDHATLSNWFLRAAWTAKATLDDGATAACDSGVEAVAQSVSAITILLRSLIGLFVLLGLLGTIFGLSVAVQDLLPTLQQAQQGAELNNVIQSLEKTLASLGSAFRITLSGLVPTIVLSLLYGIYAFRLECKFSRIKGWLHHEALPVLQAGYKTESETEDPNAQMALLLNESREEMSEMRTQTQQFLAQWRAGMNQIATQIAESVGSMQSFSNAISGMAGTTDKLSGTTDKLNEAAGRISSILEASQTLGRVGDRLTTLSDAILQTSAELRSSTDGFKTTLIEINQSVGAMTQQNHNAHQRFMDRNNLQIAALDDKFKEWKAQQTQIASDLNKTLGMFRDSSKEYVDVLTQTQKTLMNTAGMEKMIRDSEKSLREWQALLKKLHEDYLKALRESKNEATQNDDATRRSSEG